MVAGRWIDDLTMHTAAVDAARRVLTVRLEVVRAALPLALRESDKDVEHVHQLRVSTRRARAALDIFAVCLPGKAYKQAKRSLRDLRRAAGGARDWDVFLQHLVDWSFAARDRRAAGIDYLTGCAAAQRSVAQSGLEQAGRGYPFDFDRLLAETVAAVHKPRDAGVHMLIDLARPLLGNLLNELEHAVDQDLDDYVHLHKVRIIGKRLRYAMEIFACCFAAEFRTELYPVVEEMQEILGRANDHFVARQRIAALRDQCQVLLPGAWRRFKPGIEALLQHHEEELPRERDHFKVWWRRWRHSDTPALLAELIRAPEPAWRHDGPNLPFPGIHTAPLETPAAPPLALEQ